MYDTAEMLTILRRIRPFWLFAKVLELKRQPAIPDSWYDALLLPLTSTLLHWPSCVLQVVKYLTLLLVLAEGDIQMLLLFPCLKLTIIGGFFVECYLIIELVRVFQVVLLGCC